MTDLFEAAAQRRTPAQLAARALSILIDNGTTITRAMMNATMTSAYGGNDASGRWTQRDSFEVLEHALALSLSAAADATFTRENIDRSIALMNRLPTQTVRSEEQLDWQQFSTPVDLAAVAVMLADAQPGDVVLEPSAGNGLLVCQLPRVAELQINELNETRRGRLADIFPGTTITGHDGAAIASTLADKNPPSLILMNPPFSRSLGRGTDHLAAVRHLAAAITHLRPGGRIVAVMPDWFSRSAKMREIFESTLATVTVRTSIRLEQAYTKHGTSIAVRLYVLDKMPGSRTFTTIQRRDVAGLADSLEIVPRTPMVEELRKPAAPIKAISLFGATRKAKPAAPRIFRAPVRNNVLPVGYKALETPAPLLEQAGVYLPYRPSRVIFDTAGEHPTALVESVAMGSIPAPIPQHIPQLPERTVSERLLSASQLETVVYAGHAWGQWLPGKFKPDPEGVGLLIDEEGASYRKGFFLGDGTGAGKGRQVAATILDNWLQGRRRAIWISKNEPLLDDARRDWAALGGLAADVQSLSRWKIHEPLTGLALLDADGVIKEDLPPIQRWLNRLLALPIGHQNVIFDEFLALVETRVAAARDAGTLDIGVETMQVETATKAPPPEKIAPGGKPLSARLSDELAMQRRDIHPALSISSLPPENAMPEDKPTTERSITASIAVFLFAIAKNWREVRVSDGTRIPNHLFASSRAAGFLLEDGPPEHLRQEWNIPPGPVHLGPTKDTIDDVVAYLGLGDADIQFLERYYRLIDGIRPFSLISDRRKFMALCQRTPGFTVDMRDFAELAAPASPDARYADPETLDELLYLDPDTLVPLNATYEFVLGKGDRDAGRRALNELELGADILVREDGIHIAIKDFVDFIDTEPDDTPPRRPTRWLPRLRNIIRR